MNPMEDPTPFTVSIRSFKEELNLTILPRSIRLLGVALEKEAAFAAYCFVAETKEKTSGIVAKWRKAKRFLENTALLAVEMTDIDNWLKADEILPGLWYPSLLAGDIASDAKLNFHPTSPWRINLAREYAKGGKKLS